MKPVEEMDVLELTDYVLFDRDDINWIAVKARAKELRLEFLRIKMRLAEHKGCSRWGVADEALAEIVTQQPEKLK